MLTLLIGSALRAVALAVLVGAALAVFRVRNPLARLTAWTAVLIAALLMPVIVLSVPAFVGDLLFLFGWNTYELPGALEVTAAARSASAAAAAFPWLAAVYVAVAGVLLLKLALGVVLTLRLRRQATPVREDWTAGFDVRVSARVSSPVSFAATILLPPEYADWNAEQRRSVIAHERAHICHGDLYVQMLAGFHRCIFWFSPLSWWLYARLIYLGELASDADVIATTEDRDGYVATLLALAGGSSVVGVAMARPQTLARRIERIVSDAPAQATLSRSKRAALAALIVPLAVACASLSPPLDAGNMKAAELESRRIVAPHSNPQRPVTQPIYPAEAKAARQQGQVVMYLIVAPTGDVSKVDLDRSSGYPLLDNAAMTEAKDHWRLIPGTVNGKPTTMRYRFSVTFKITDPPETP